MHKATLIRTVTHTYNAHNPLAMMTGFADGPHNQIFAKPSDPPDVGAICQYLGLGPRDLPGAVCMPCYPGYGEAIRRPGPYGGYLGQSVRSPVHALRSDLRPQTEGANYDPVPPIGDPKMPSLEAIPEMTVARLGGRRGLVEQLDQQFRAAENSGSMARLEK